MEFTDPKAKARIIEDTGWKDEAAYSDQRRGRHKYVRTVRYADDEDITRIVDDIQRIKQQHTQQPTFVRDLAPPSHRHLRFTTEVDSGG